MEMNRLYDKSAFRLKQFYDDLIDFLKKKQEEQLETMAEKQKETAKNTAMLYSAIAEHHILMKEKFRTYGNVEIKNELLIPSKAVLEIINSNVDRYDPSSIDLQQYQL